MLNKIYIKKSKGRNKTACFLCENKGEIKQPVFYVGKKKKGCVCVRGWGGGGG